MYFFLYSFIIIFFFFPNEIKTINGISHYGNFFGIGPIIEGKNRIATLSIMSVRLIFHIY